MADYSYQEQDKFVEIMAEDDFLERMALVKGDEFREYRRKWDMAGRFELETPGPIHVDFELSHHCQLKCPMCPFGLPSGHRPAGFDDVDGFMAFDLYRKVIDEGIPLGLKSIQLSFYNEPLLRKDLVDLIQYAAQQGIIDIMFSSNGLLLTPEMTEKLLDSGLTRFMVSLDANSEDVYQKMRVGGDFKTAVDNMEYFLKRKKERKQILPITRVSFVKTKLNEHELEAFIARWKPMVDYLSIQELEEYEEMGFTLTPISLKTNLDFKCHMPWHRVVIRVDGDVLPCCMVKGMQLVMGNIYKQSLQEIWLGQGMRDLRQLHKEGRYYDNPVCKACAESTVCRTP
jgi:radical SAM protein with 4Fe4S-binding SPASM domain